MIPVHVDFTLKGIENDSCMYDFLQVELKVDSCMCHLFQVVFEKL